MSHHLDTSCSVEFDSGCVRKSGRSAGRAPRMLHRAFVLIALLVMVGLATSGLVDVPNVRAEKTSNETPATVAVATLQGSRTFPATKGRAYFLSATRDGRIVSRFGVQVLDLVVPAGTEL